MKFLKTRRCRTAVVAHNIFELQPLEQRVLFAFQLGVNFQPAEVNTPPGYQRDQGMTYATRPNGFAYGWSADNTANVFDRNVNSDQRKDTFALMQPGGTPRNWEIAVPNATYQVRIVAGDPNAFDGTYKINVENTLVVNGTPTSTNRFVDATANVTVTDGRITLSNATGASNNRVAFVEITDASRLSATPSVPTNFRARASSTTGVDLIWDDNADNDTGFLIERSANGTSGWTAVTTTSPNSTLAFDTGRTANTTYYYRVRAANADPAVAANFVSTSVTTLASAGGQVAYNTTNAPWSPTATGVTIQAEDFDTGGEGVADHDFDADNIGGLYRSGNVDIARYVSHDSYVNTNGYFVGWTHVGEWMEYTVDVPLAGSYLFEASVANGDPGGSFHVEFAGTDETGAIAVPDTNNTNGYTTVSRAVTLGAGQQVMAVKVDTVTAGNSGGNVNWFRLTLRPPDAPTGLTATAASTTSINLAWQDASGESGYKIERATGAAGTFAQIATVGAGVTTYASGGLAPATLYRYRVRATNAAGDSAYSTIAEANTAGTTPTPPTAPSGLQATVATGPAGATRLDLAWTDNATDETAYLVERSTDGGATFAQVASLAAGVTAYAATGLEPSTAYGFRVRATNAGGPSAYTNVATATTAAALVPTQLNDGDIGNPALAGGSSLTAPGAFTVSGGGADIYGTSDQFHYKYTTLTGDGTITARVTSIQNTNASAKAGVMRPIGELNEPVQLMLIWR